MRNPHDPYTQQWVDWQRQQDQDREARANQWARDYIKSWNRSFQPTGSTTGPLGTNRTTSVDAATQRRTSRAIGVLTRAGSFIGVLLAVGLGERPLVGLILGALAGAVILPLIWIAIALIKLALILFLVLIVIGGLLYLLTG